MHHLCWFLLGRCSHAVNQYVQRHHDVLSATITTKQASCSDLSRRLQRQLHVTHRLIRRRSSSVMSGESTSPWNAMGRPIACRKATSSCHSIGCLGG